MPEYLDILDEKGNKTGESRTYAEVHQLGLLHRAVHIWIVNSDRQILLQKRAARMAAYPNYWDISSSGHISKGESSLEAAKKEVKEELGIELEDADLKLFGTAEEHIVLNNGTHISNQFQDLYVVHKDVAIEELKLELKEVGGVRWIDIPTFEAWIRGEGELIVPHAEEYRLLLLYLKSLKEND